MFSLEGHVRKRREREHQASAAPFLCCDFSSGGAVCQFRKRVAAKFFLPIIACVRDATFVACGRSLGECVADAFLLPVGSSDVYIVFCFLANIVLVGWAATAIEGQAHAVKRLFEVTAAYLVPPFSCSILCPAVTFRPVSQSLTWFVSFVADDVKRLFFLIIFLVFIGKVFSIALLLVAFEVRRGQAKPHPPNDVTKF